MMSIEESIMALGADPAIAKQVEALTIERLQNESLEPDTTVRGANAPRQGWLGNRKQRRAAASGKR